MQRWRSAASAALIAFAVLFGVLALLFVGGMALVQSEWAERRVEGMAGERLGRAVDVEGLRIAAAWPPRVVMDELRIANPEWAQDPHFVRAQDLSAVIRPAPLLRGRLVVTAAVDDAATWFEKQGERATWNIGAEGSPGERDAPEEAQQRSDRFTLEALTVGQLGLVYRDAGNETEVFVLAHGDLGREGQGVQAQARGRLRGSPLQAKAEAPTIPLKGDAPVDVAFEIALAETVTTGQVAVRATSDELKSIEGRIEAGGPSLAALKRVAGRDLPESAPYHLTASVRHERHVTQVEDLEATIGDSDVQGRATLDLSGERPFLQANLTSTVLDVEDAGLKAEAKEELQKKYLIPRDPWPSDALHALDAEIEIRVKEVRNAQPVPMDALELRVVLEEASLQVDPLRVSLANGSVNGRLALDASEAPERGSAYVEIRGLRLSRLVPEVANKEGALGRLNGRIELSGRGNTPAALLGSADGRILFAAERGTASGLLVEILGLDAAEAVMLLGKRKTPLPLRCAVVDLDVKNGRAKASPFVIDATDSVLSVEGTLDLGKERLDLKARTEPRDVSPFTLRTPVDITGTFLDPKITPQPGPLVGRAAGAIALAAINPILAIIPFVDPGGDPEGGCRPQKP